MQTISAEEFKRRFGISGVAQFQQTTPKEGAIKTAFKSGIEQAKQGYSRAVNAKNPYELLSGSTQMAAGGIGAAFSPTAPATQYVGKGIEYAGEKISDIPAVQKFAQTKAGEITAKGAEDVANLSTLVGTVGGFMGGPKVVSGVKGTASRATSKATGLVKEGLGKVKEKIPGMKTLDPLETAISDATPSYEALSPTQKGKYLSRVKEGGILKGRSITPDKMNIEAGEQLSKVPGYDPNATKLAKYQVANEEVIRMAKELDTSLANEKIIVPKKELVVKVQKAIDKVPEKSLLLQKADPVIKNYIRVFKNAVKNVKGDLKGVLDLRKTLDDAYENARGKQAFGSDKISALDEVNKAARNILTNYLIDKAKNVDVKASLRSQWNLFRALDELKIAAEKESGSFVGRFMQENPIATKFGEMGIKATGLGAGLGILK